MLSMTLPALTNAELHVMSLLSALPNDGWYILVDIKEVHDISLISSLIFISAIWFAVFLHMLFLFGVERICI